MLEVPLDVVLGCSGMVLELTAGVASPFYLHYNNNILFVLINIVLIIKIKINLF